MRRAHFFRERRWPQLSPNGQGGPEPEGVDGDGPMTAVVSPSDDASGRSVAGGMPLKQTEMRASGVEGIDETAGVVWSTESSVRECNARLAQGASKV